MNTTILMSGVDFFSDEAPINPFMDKTSPIDLIAAAHEHAQIRAQLEHAGITVLSIPAPKDCQDGVFTANWALVHGDTAILARLPNARKAEESYARTTLQSLGKTVVELPLDIERFSGQGDALICGQYLFAGSGYRSAEAAQQFAAETFGLELVQLHAKPLLDAYNHPVINEYSGWPDSFFYDIDLAVSILRPPQGLERGLIGYCPEALTADSIARIQALAGIDCIEVSLEEATRNLACNLVSTGHTVIMNDAPNFAAAIEAHGLKTIRLHNPELAKGGGSVRCTTLTLG